jgi:hypothetical protein
VNGATAPFGAALPSRVHLTTRTHPVRMSGALFERPAELRLALNSEAQLIDHTLGGEPFPAV